MKSTKFPSSGRERGASAIMILIFLIMAAACLMVGFKLYPAFFEHWQVESIVDSFEEEPGLEDLSVKEISRRFNNRLTTNNVRSFNFNEYVEIVKEDNELGIYVEYEVRLNMYRNIDAVIKFKKTLEKSF